MERESGSTPDGYGNEWVAPDRRTFVKLSALGATGLGATASTSGCAGADTSGDGPRRVVPVDRSLGLGAGPPSDGEVLWDGDDHRLDDHWEMHGDGSEPAWNENADFFEAELGSGDIATTRDIGDCHLHLEWRAPPDAEGEDQHRCNSGVFMMENYELQVLDTYNNPTYDWGWAGSQYGEAAPLVSPMRPTGEWQSYDILWRGPRWNDSGELERPARITLLFNGTLVLFHHRVGGEVTADKGSGEYSQHPPEMALRLQDHGDDPPPQYRNVWYQPFPDVEADPVDRPAWGADHTGEPAYVRPNRPGTSDPASDAGYLIEDGRLDGWEGVDGGEPGWNEHGGFVSVEPGSGDIRTEESLGDCQLHVEWRVPGRGGGSEPAASALALMERYTLPLSAPTDGDADARAYPGAYPGQAAPRVDAVREGNEWQTMEVLFQAPRFEEGEVAEPARLSALVNGVMVQERFLPDGPNLDGEVGSYEPHDVREPLRLVDDGSPVQIRNLWYRRFPVTDGERDYNERSTKDQLHKYFHDYIWTNVPEVEPPDAGG